MTLIEYLAKNPKKHLIFDLDNTLVKLHIDWSFFRAEFKKAMEKVDIDLASKYSVKDHSSHFYNVLIKKNGRRAKIAADLFCSRYEKKYLTGILKNNNLISFLKKNQFKYDFYLWTGNNQKTVLPLLDKLKLTPYFKKTVCKENSQFIKPDADGFYQIFNPKKQNRKDFLMIGDDYRDELAAKAARIDFFKINSDFSS